MATLTELQSELSELKVAKSAALKAQAYKDPMGTMITRPDLAVLIAEIHKIETRIELATNSGVLSHANAIFKGTR